MIEVSVPKEKIPFIRTIEGRRFKEGRWLFPFAAQEKLFNLGLIDNIIAENKSSTDLHLSPFLMKHQKNIVTSAINNKSFGIFSDTGTGKTVMGLEIAKHFKKVLVVCPLSIIQTAWIDDCNKFYPNLKIISLWDKDKKIRLKNLNSECDIYVINYDGFKILYNEILAKNFDCVIVDESSKMKNIRSIITQKLLSFSEQVKHRYVLSGCPTPNHNSEIFPQMKFVNPEIFGNNYHGFLAKYFSQDMANPHKWFQTQDNKDAYFSRLSEQSIFVKKDDCVDLPEKIYQIRKCGMYDTQKKYYTQILNDIKSNINTWSKFEFTAKLMKLREVLSGFVIQKDRNILEFKSKKDDELKLIMNELHGNKVIVWCQFNYEIDKLSKKFGGVGLHSNTPQRDNVINAFKDDKIEILFAHPKLLGHGLTFVNCNYNIYYSLSYSYEEFKQSQDRIHRYGQKEKCTYIILQTEDSIDEKIYKCLNNKKNAVDEIYMEMGFNANGE